MKTARLMPVAPAMLLLAPAIAAAESAATSPAAGIGQTLFALAAVIAVVFGMAWFARRLGVQTRGGNALIKVISSVNLGPRERLVIVESDDAWLVLGVTPQQISLLQTRARGEAPSKTDLPLAQQFSALLKQAGNRREK